MKNGGVVGKQEKWISSRFKVLYIFFIYFYSQLWSLLESKVQTGLEVGGVVLTKLIWPAGHSAPQTSQPRSGQTDQKRGRVREGRTAGGCWESKMLSKTRLENKDSLIRRRNSTDFFIFLFVHADSSHQCIVSRSLNDLHLTLWRPSLCKHTQIWWRRQSMHLVFSLPLQRKRSNNFEVALTFRRRISSRSRNTEEL